MECECFQYFARHLSYISQPEVTCSGAVFCASSQYFALSFHVGRGISHTNCLFVWSFFFYSSELSWKSTNNQQTAKSCRWKPVGKHTLIPSYCEMIRFFYFQNIQQTIYPSFGFHKYALDSKKVDHLTSSVSVAFAFSCSIVCLYTLLRPKYRTKECGNTH